MTPKEKLVDDLLKLISDFHRDTGVVVTNIDVGWFDITGVSKIIHTYTLQEIELRLK